MNALFMKKGRIKRKKWQAVLQSAVIIIFAGMAGLLTNQDRSNKLSLVADWSPEARLISDSGENLVISLEEARDLCSDQGAIFIDARSPEDYGLGHIRKPSCRGNQDNT